MMAEARAYIKIIKNHQPTVHEYTSTWKSCSLHRNGRQAMALFLHTFHKAGSCRLEGNGANLDVQKIKTNHINNFLHAAFSNRILVAYRILILRCHSFPWPATRKGNWILMGLLANGKRRWPLEIICGVMQRGFSPKEYRKVSRFAVRNLPIPCWKSCVFGWL